MSLTLLNQILAYGLPFLALVGPGFFKRDGLTPTQNGQIAFAVVVILGLIQAYAAGVLGANPYEDFAAVSGIVTGMQAGPLKWLDAYLQSNVGLKSSPAQSEEFTVTTPGSGLPPAPIILPNATKTPTDSPQPKQ